MASRPVQAEPSLEAIAGWLSQQYDHPVILRQEGASFVVQHAGGITRVPVASIPARLQQASQDVIYTPLDSDLVITFTNASRDLRRTLLDNANEHFVVVEGRVEPVTSFYRYTGMVRRVIKPQHYLLDDNVVISDPAIHGVGVTIKGLARADGTISESARIKRFRSAVIPFREAVYQSDDDGNCYLDFMSIYLVRPHPYNQEVIDGTVISGYAVEDGMHKYDDALGVTRRIRKWRMLTPAEVEAETEYVTQETVHALYSSVQHRPMTENEFLAYLQANTSATFRASLPHPCPGCKSAGTRVSATEYEAVQVACRACAGKGRVAVKAKSSYSMDKKETLGTVQSVNPVTYVNCSSCGGTGRTAGNRPREVPCGQCAGKGSVSVVRPVTCVY